MPTASSEHETGFRLKRTIGLWHGVLVTSGVIIGSGIFLSPNGVFRAANGSVGVSLLIWVFGGVIAFLSSLCYCELATSVKESGGDYIYFNAAYGPTMAFLIPWLQILVPSATSLTILLFARYAIEPVFGSHCAAPDWAVRLVALSLLYLILFINCVSVKLALRIQSCLTCSKFVAMLVIIGGAIFQLSVDPSVAVHNFQNAWNEEVLGGLSFLSLSTAFYQVMWSYDGWSVLGYVVEEMKDVEKNITKATFLTLATVVVAYLFLNAAYLCVLTPLEMTSSKAVAFTFGTKLFNGVPWIAPLTVCLCTAGSLNASVLSYGRLNYVAARRGHLPKVFGMLHIKTFTPNLSLWLSSVMVTALVFIGNIDSLLEVFGFVNWTFYALSALSVLILRKKLPDLERPFMVPAVIPVAVFAISIFFVVLQFINNPHFLYFYALIYFVFGSVLFQVFAQRKLIRVNTISVTTFAQKLFQVAPADWDKVVS